MINHPSYNPHAAGCTEQDVSDAIDRSAETGEEIGLEFSETAARLLHDCAEWESDDEHDYRGEQDGKKWSVFLRAPKEES